MAIAHTTHTIHSLGNHTTPSMMEIIDWFIGYLLMDPDLPHTLQTEAFVFLKFNFESILFWRLVSMSVSIFKRTETKYVYFWKSTYEGCGLYYLLHWNIVVTIFGFASVELQEIFFLAAFVISLWFSYKYHCDKEDYMNTDSDTHIIHYWLTYILFVAAFVFCLFFDSLKKQNLKILTKTFSGIVNRTYHTASGTNTNSVNKLFPMFGFMDS